MNMLKKRTLNTLLIIGFACLAAFCGFKWQKLKSTNLENQQQLTKLEQELSAYQSIEKTDSLILSGDYERAIETYTHLIHSGNPADSAKASVRLNFLKKIKTEVAGSFSPEVVYDTVFTMIGDHPAFVREKDSMLFVQQKANALIAHLEKELSSRSTGEYLTFKNARGNVVHYVGEVKNGKANGKGIGILNTGSHYEGHWKDNMRHGDGKFFWPDGQYYVGHYKNDLREGEGTYFWPDNQKFSGEWSDDKRNGNGTFYTNEGESVMGVWKDDELVKQL